MGADVGHCWIQETLGKHCNCVLLQAACTQAAEETLAMAESRIEKSRKRCAGSGDPRPPVAHNGKQQPHSASTPTASSKGLIDDKAEADILEWIEQLADTRDWA